MRRLFDAALHPRAHRWGLRPWRRHSLVLALAGCAYVAIGITYLTSSPVPSRTSALQVAVSAMPLTSWGVVWIVVGVSAVASSRWPPASETWGYAAMSALAAGWSACYMLGVILGAHNQSLSGALVWGLVAFMWWAIAGLVNPDDIQVCASCVDSAGRGMDA